MLCKIFAKFCYFFVDFWRAFCSRFVKLLDIAKKLRYNENRKLRARAERRDYGNSLG